MQLPYSGGADDAAVQLTGFALAPWDASERLGMVEPIIECDVVVIGGINNDYVIRGRLLPDDLLALLMRFAPMPRKSPR